MKKIVNITYLERYRLLLEFDNGEKRVYDREEFGFDGIWQYIQDINNFKDVKLIFGALTWFRNLELPENECNELDICPDYTYMVSTPYVAT